VEWNEPNLTRGQTVKYKFFQESCLDMENHDFFSSKYGELAFSIFQKQPARVVCFVKCLQTTFGKKKFEGFF